MKKFTNYSLLYIEDNMDIQSNIAAFLKNHGYTVHVTDNVDDGCDLFRTNKIDIIVTDLHLSDQNGLEFVRCLRNKEIPTPVVITTAFDDRDMLLDAINLDITHYLVKPFKKSDLLSAILKAAKKLPSPAPTPAPRVLKQGYSYDMINKSIIHPEGNNQRLSKKEHLLLELLLAHPNQIVSYDQIESTVWKTTPMSLFALRTLVNSVRNKGYPSLILNASGLGYKYED